MIRYFIIQELAVKIFENSSRQNHINNEKHFLITHEPGFAVIDHRLFNRIKAYNRTTEKSNSLSTALMGRFSG